jgi:trimeric autotransporter adhesin
MSAGPSFNFGYGGASFGEGAGFFNVRPDAMATPPNPSVRFMTANLERMIITNAGNVGIGTSAPSQKLEIVGNLAIPATASGGTAGAITQGGSRLLHAFGSGSVFLGLNAGNFTFTGINNTALGSSALLSDTTGFSNTAIGTSALSSNTTGSSNVAIGPSALSGNIVGSLNVAIGDSALRVNTGSSNVAIGPFALQNNTSGGSNLALGEGAGQNLTTGISNIDIGNHGVAGESDTIRIGTSPLQSRAFIAGVRGVTTGVADGQGVLIDSNGQLGTIGNVSFSNNLAIPATASGGTAGVINLGGIRFVHGFGANNTFVGPNAGNFTMTGAQNTAGGAVALQNNTTGSDNTATGFTALQINTTGNDNTANGFEALVNNTTGSNNIAIGSFAGFNLTTGSNNIDVGNQGVTAEANTIRIGTSGTQTRAFIAGISGVTTGGAAVAVLVDANGQLGTASSSRRYKFDISDMGESTASLMRLRPVTFRYLAHGDGAPLQYGLIAEEVAEVNPELVTRDKDGQPETVMYQFLAPMLLNEVQKQQRLILDQQTILDDQRAENTALRQRIERLETLIAAMDHGRTGRR